MGLTAREQKHLAEVANTNGHIVRLLQTINSNLIEMHRVACETNTELRKISKELTRDIDLDKLVEDSKKIAEAGANFEQYQAGGEIPKKKWWIGQRVVVSEPSSALVGYQGEIVTIMGEESVGVLLDGRSWKARIFHVNHLAPILPEIKLPEYPATRTAEDRNRLGVPFSVTDLALVIDPNTIMHNRVGKVTQINNDGTIEVQFDGGMTGAEYTRNQLEHVDSIEDANQLEIPSVVEYVTDTEGRLFPWQWRHNLGRDKLPEEIRMQHQPHENHPMTEEAFRIYDAGLVSEFVVKTKQEEQK